ncbi:MAG TPA: hypothetical protein VLU95_06115 [Candidatus Acidoferrum sp.]|nr:hypothetical protein [Candidatus Acidoferrum sp.]
MSEKNVRGKSKLIIVAIVVIAVVVVGIGIYAATRGGGTSPSTSTTPTASSSGTTTPKPTSTSTNKIATATSYEFNETGTASNGTVLDTVFYATKNVGTSNVDLIEVVTTPSSGTLEYIVNGAQQKAWVYQGGQWTDLSSEFSTILPTEQSAAGIYTNMLEAYGGSGSYTYTIPSGQPNAGDKATFTNIQINPSLPDSLFQPPA